MKKEIIIYSNIKSINFFDQIFNNYIIVYKSISDLFILGVENGDGIIIYNETKNKNHLDPISLKKNYILITNSTSFENIKKDNIIFLKTPITLDKIRNNIEKFLLNQKIFIGEIEIFNQKLKNNNNKKSCLLTDIESEILLHLIKNTECTKQYIKKNILNLKSTIQTNSIDSHLTRIRKKLDKIETKIKIHSKNDIILIKSN